MAQGADDTAESLIAYCTQSGRICPMPSQWNELWKMLPGRERIDNGWQPPLPLILGAWHYASPQEKASRLREHIVWASEHDALTLISTFLRDLPEQKWFHESD